MSQKLKKNHVFIGTVATTTATDMRCGEHAIY